MKERKQNADIFEIGIYRGSSLKMWSDYFESGKVCGIDNGRLLPNTKAQTGYDNQNPSLDDLKLLEGQCFDCDFSWIETDRIKCAIADQRNSGEIEKAFRHFGIDTFDFIVDDGHHYQEHQLKTLSILLKNVKSDGFYIIEDVIKYSDLLNGSFWGQHKSDASDSTDFIFTKFIETGIFKSEYLNHDECQYISDNIKDVFIYDSPHPIQSSSKLIVIRKK